MQKTWLMVFILTSSGIATGATSVSRLQFDGVPNGIGIDTRTSNGGNGNWDGVTGTPTYMQLILSALPAGSYN